MEHQPTPEQQKIIDEPQSCVVIAKPGTGKTLTLAYKIRNILCDLLYFRGVIAISFTNKASNELESRSLATGVDRQNSFFGTIDKFFLAEIIFPFGERVLGKPQKEIEVVLLSDIEPSDYGGFDKHKSDLGNLDFFASLFTNGKVLLDKLGFLAIYILKNSIGCRRYIKARFTHVIIDEYQDCDLKQHELFMEMVELGLIGVAVGDVDQSIFAFANKSSEHLVALAGEIDKYTTYALSINHRSHPSIINYSARLLSATFKPNEVNEIRVYEKTVEGTEIEIAQWLSSVIPELLDHYSIEEFNKVGILVSNRRTGNLIHRNLALPHKSLVTTPLDQDSSLWGAVFRRALHWVYNPDVTKIEFVEKYLSFDYQIKTVKRTLNLLGDIENLIEEGNDLIENIANFEQVAKILFPNARNEIALTNLASVLTTPIFLSSFIPPTDEEVQLLTLHKAKGLEFNIVFHLNLYRWILPRYKGDPIQNLNLHYVGVTRAKDCCVLCTSTHRHNYQNEVVEAENSEYFERNELGTLRLPLNK